MTAKQAARKVRAALSHLNRAWDSLEKMQTALQEVASDEQIAAARRKVARQAARDAERARERVLVINLDRLGYLADDLDWNRP